MLNSRELETAVDLAQRGYRLLRWVARAIEQRTLPFDEVHDNLVVRDTARRWVTRFQPQFPADARPPSGQENRFANYFASFLTTSFDLVEEPGKIARTDCGCLCPLCRYLINAPHLQTKRLTKRDKRSAESLKRDVLAQLAIDLDIPIVDRQLDSIVVDPELRESVALLSYGRELLRRCAGVSSGPEVLVLWRQFAWTPEGSPRKDFKLTAELMLEAEARIEARLFAALD